MSKLISVIMVIAILLAAYSIVQVLPAEIAYAAQWDAGVPPPNTFLQWSGLASVSISAVQGCRQEWLAQRDK